MFQNVQISAIPRHSVSVRNATEFSSAPTVLHNIPFLPKYCYMTNKNDIQQQPLDNINNANFLKIETFKCHCSWILSNQSKIWQDKTWWMSKSLFHKIFLCQLVFLPRAFSCKKFDLHYNDYTSYESQMECWFFEILRLHRSQLWGN